MNTPLKKYLLILVFFATNILVFAQTTPPPPNPPPPGLPIDGGIIFLAILGLGYGVTKIKK